MSTERAPHTTDDGTTDDDSPRYSTADAAAYLGTSVWTIRRYAGEGALRGYRIGSSKRGQLRFRRADLDALLTDARGRA
ncbi:helix-turn-helix domain-containing protein [Tsukamurella asaccharolytica]|uniref:Helix-turn-helix domain-containing protein n=1 Tax=Tsukamurella asaccharolytica TaxID=2592067 RepID=A0A5C5RBQ4_9ACTN|nr:helix-turn-helix domain-containing protein [Tsukamurella asaccharolytica]TWS20206.1 helix-turn-helix domain-containing protein [Tsukamurella asaccharolytica]